MAAGRMAVLLDGAVSGVLGELLEYKAMRLIMGLKCNTICGGKRACLSGVDGACPLLAFRGFLLKVSRSGEGVSGPEIDI